MRPNWQGVFPAVTTQLRRDQALDLASTARHIEMLISAGVQGLVMLSPTGENETLSRDEKLRVMETTLNMSNGRVPVLSGVCESGTASACGYARDLEEMGADGLLVFPPTGLETDARETTGHFQAVIRATPLPVLISLPSTAPIELLAGLADETNLAGVQGDACSLREAYGARFLRFDEVATEPTNQPDGWITSLGQAFPRETLSLWRHLQQVGTRGSTNEIGLWFKGLLEFDPQLKPVQRIKLALQELGLGSEWVRGPRLPLEGPERARVRQFSRDWIDQSPARENEINELMRTK